MEIRDRILELIRVPASELQANPRNWRRHSAAQRAALAGMLGQVGIANAVVARRDKSGALVLIDGHLRSDVLKASEAVPVLVLDVNEQEADALLATMDPLAMMAETDGAALAGLLGSVEDDALRGLLESMTHDAGVTPDFEPVGEDEQGRLDQKAPITCPKCGHEFTT